MSCNSSGGSLSSTPVKSSLSAPVPSPAWPLSPLHRHPDQILYWPSNLAVLIQILLIFGGSSSEGRQISPRTWAYVTFLAGNGDYVKDIVGLVKEVQKVKTAYPSVVAVLGGLLMRISHMVRWLVFGDWNWRTITLSVTLRLQGSDSDVSTGTTEDCVDQDNYDFRFFDAKINGEVRVGQRATKPILCGGEDGHSYTVRQHCRGRSGVWATSPWHRVGVGRWGWGSRGGPSTLMEGRT